MTIRSGSTIDPNTSRPHRELKSPAAGVLGTGAALANGTAISVVIPIAGAAVFFARFKASVAGTLSCAFLRPDGTTAYTTGNPTDVAVLANTEARLTIDTLYGESQLKITFTPSAGPGTVTFLDVGQLP